MRQSRERRWPLRLLAFFMALLTGLSSWAFLLCRVLTDETLYRQAAVTTLPEREHKFEDRIHALAEAEGFDTDTVMAFYTAERRKQIAEDGAKWVLSILSGRETEAPDSSAILENESGILTLEETLTPLLPGSRFKAEAKAQELSAKIERMAARNLLPMRSTLLRMADERIDAYRGTIKKLIRYIDLAAWILAGLALLCALLLCLIWRWERFGIAYAGAGLAAGGLGGAAVFLPILVLNITGIIKEVSSVFAAETEWILGRLMARHFIICGAMVLIGFTAFLLGRKRRKVFHEI